MKAKLSVDEQIDYMKNARGVKFSIVNEAEAREFLLKNNYYFKLKSYAKNYDKYLNGPNKDKYINLEFAYLKELSTLDMHLRKSILQMTLDIEHYLKTQLLRHLESNPLESGYDVVQKFLSENSQVVRNIEFQKGSVVERTVACLPTFCSGVELVAKRIGLEHS